MQVELVWHRGCPHVGAARKNLLAAFRLAGLPPRWQEWCTDDPDCPDRARGYGSPTILVEGKDVAGARPGEGSSCRVYLERAGSSPAPSPETIAAALRAAADAGAGKPGGAETGRDAGVSSGGGGAKDGWSTFLAALPAAGVALLPKVACPACWPAYAGVLSSLGVSFLIDARYLFALTAAFLAVALFFLAFRARRRHGYGPFGLGLAASGVLLVGKFHFESDPAMYAGVALLMGASLWNSWPRRAAAPCPACLPTGGRGPSPAAAAPAPCCAGPDAGRAASEGGA